MSFQFVCVCVCVCVHVCKILVPHNNFQTSSLIITKYWLYMVSNRNTPTPQIQLLNFENIVHGRNFLNLFFPFN